MNILYIGAGFVGACSAAVSAASGHNVLVYDIDEHKVEMLSSGDRDTIEFCLHESGLGDLLVRNQERIKFTTDYTKVAEFLDTGEAIFMCLPTPEIGETGESDLTYYNQAAEKLAQVLAKRNPSSSAITPDKSVGEQSKYIVIINKSTVPVAMVDKTKEILANKGVKNFGIVSNPEFLVEGKAVAGSLKPDRVVVGAWQEKDFAIMRKIYQRFYDSPTTKYIEVNPKEAAASKLLANFTLFNKLQVCYDVVGRTCEAFADLQFENIRKVLISDPRIGSWGFYNSLYAGGSCFIKDARSLAHQLKTAGKNNSLVNEVYLANKRQLDNFMARAEKEANFAWQGKTVALIGTAFKRDTNDIRNAPSIEIGYFLQKKQVKKIKVYDPVALDNFKLVFPESETIEYYNHEFVAIKDAEVIIIATDWPQFRGLADIMMSELKNRPLIMDGRRMLQHRYNDLSQAGFDIIAVGSPFLKANK